MRSEYPGLGELSSCVDLRHSCGFVSLLGLERTPNEAESKDVSLKDVRLVPLFANSLGRVAARISQHPCYLYLDYLASHSHLQGVRDVDPKRLLEEEVDSVDSAVAGGGCDRRILSLDLGQKTGSAPELEWILFDVKFGVPLFDADLNRKVTPSLECNRHCGIYTYFSFKFLQICNCIVRHGLWKKESLETLTRTSKDLCRRLMEFINNYQVQSIVQR